MTHFFASFTQGIIFMSIFTIVFILGFLSYLAGSSTNFPVTNQQPGEKSLVSFQASANQSR